MQVLDQRDHDLAQPRIRRPLHHGKRRGRDILLALDHDPRARFLF